MYTLRWITVIRSVKDILFVLLRYISQEVSYMQHVSSLLSCTDETLLTKVDFMEWRRSACYVFKLCP